MKMIFHNKQTNAERKNNFVRPIKNPPAIIKPQLLQGVNVFSEPMIQRVVKARSGCSACGK